MRRWLIVLACLATALSACQRTRGEHVRVVPQVSPVEPKRVEFSPLEQNRLLVMEASGRVGVWDIAGDTLHLFASIPARAIDAQFATDGRSLLTAGVDGRVRNWTLDGQLRWLSKGGHGAPARALAVSSDLIASGGEDGAIRLWKHDGSPLGEIANAHERPVMSLAISPGGDLASLGGDEVMRLWERVGGAAAPGQAPKFEPVVLFQPEKRRYPYGFMQLVWLDVSWGWDRSVAFSPKGDVIAGVLFDGSVRLWNADGTSRAVVAKAHRERQVRALAFSPNGDMLASSGFDGTTRLWNLDGSPRGEPVANHYHNVFSVTFARDGSRLATTGLDNQVRVWKIDGSPVLIFPRGYEDRVASVAVAPHTPLIAVADTTGGLRLWNFDGSAKAPPLAGHKGLVQAVKFSPREDVLAAAGEDGTLRLWDVNGQPQGAPMTLPAPGATLKDIGLAFSPQGDSLAVGLSHFQLWNRDRLLWQSPLRRADSVREIAFSPRGDFIVTGSTLGDVQVWNPDGSARTPALDQPLEYVAALAVAPGADYFAAVIGSSSRQISLFGLDGVQRGTPLEVPFGAVKGLAFSPSGKLVSGGEDGVVRLWTLPARTVESFDVGLPINQLGFWRDLIWVRADGESLFFYEPGGKLRATMLLRRAAALTFTPDGWFSGTSRSPRVIRAYRPSGEPLREAEVANRLSPEKVLEALEHEAY